MPEQKFDDDDFLTLWAVYGSNWSWAQYAHALSDQYGFEGDGRLKPSAVSARVSRKREQWRRERGIVVPLRRLPHTEVFSSWPELPVTMRNQALYRWLEYESLFRQLGEEGVPPSVRELGWRSGRRGMLKRDEIIRYDPVHGRLYRDKRTQREKDLDPGRERFWEPRESYVRRHPTGS